MAVPKVRLDFKEFCLRKLGKPVIEINVSNEQVDDRVDEALKWYWDYHYDGAIKVYLKHQLTQENIDTLQITVPDNLVSVSNIFPLGSFTTSTSYLFDINYHVALDTLYALNQAGMSNYYVTRMNYDLIQEILIGKSFLRFQRHTNTVHLDVSKERLRVGFWLIIEGYQRIDPSDMVFEVANTTFTIGNNTITTTESFEGAVKGSYITAGNADAFVTTLVSNTELVMDSPATTSTTVTITVEPPSDVWSDIWLQRYATALIKYQWGSNLTKFIGLQLPGGVAFNGDKIMDDAEKELEKMREELINTYSLPVYDMIG